MIKYNRIKTFYLVLISLITEIHMVMLIIRMSNYSSLFNNLTDNFLIPMLTDVSLIVPIAVILCYYYFKAYREKTGIHKKNIYWKFVLCVTVVLLGILLASFLMNDKKVLIWGLYSLFVIFNLFLYYGIVKLTEINQEQIKKYDYIYHSIFGVLLIYNIILGLVFR